MDYHVGVLDVSICVPSRAHCNFSYPQLYDTSNMGDRPLECWPRQSTMSQEVHAGE